MTKKEHLEYVLERFNQNTDAIKVLAHDAHSIGEAKDVIMNIELIKHQLENIVDKYEYLTSDWNNNSFKCSEDDENWSDEAEYKLLSYIRIGLDKIVEFYAETDSSYLFIKSAADRIETLSHMITAGSRTAYPQIAWNKLDNMEIFVSGYDKQHYDELRESVSEIKDQIQSVCDSLDQLYCYKQKKKQRKSKKRS